jgi:hypothetical protein
MDVNTERVIEGAVTGAAAGLVASWVMSEFHEAWKAASGDRDVGDEPNTVKVADAVTEATVGKPVPEGYRSLREQLFITALGVSRRSLRSRGGGSPRDQRWVRNRLRSGGVAGRRRDGDAGVGL